LATFESHGCASLHPGLFSLAPYGSVRQHAGNALFSCLVVKRRIMDDYFRSLLPSACITLIAGLYHEGAWLSPRGRGCSPPVVSFS
jgi:hypothetical protein